MRKTVLMIALLFLLAGCSGNKKLDLSSGYKPETYRADMSGYNGLKSVGHQFEGTTVSQLKRTVDEKEYGVFVLSRVECPHCQQLMHLINDVAAENDVTVYYIEADSRQYPILDTPDYDVLYEILLPAMNVVDGEKALQTPTIFAIYKGEIIDSMVGATWRGLDPSDKDVADTIRRYEQIISPFKK